MTWFLVVLLFRGDVLVDSNIFFGKGEAECKEAKELALSTPVRPPPVTVGRVLRDQARAVEVEVAGRARH